MSVIVALERFKDLFKNTKEKDFFARCITGYTYSDNQNHHDVLNCLIQLLNSNVIDVDKLDYLIRDAYITGFDTVKIDYKRLLGALRLDFDRNNQKWQLVFHKSALSVIENVVFAHDAERHWIQNHPVVLYEGYILNHAIDLANSYFSNAKHGLFSYETLTEEGNQLSENIHISLFSDDDLIFLMKNVCYDDITKEYFNRQIRRHPAWKSEAEYRNLFYGRNGEVSELTNFVEAEIDNLSKFVFNITKSDIINDDAIEACKKEIEKYERILATEKPRTRKSIEKQINEINTHLEFLECLREVVTGSGLEFDLLIIKANQFNSSFSKKEFSQLQIYFDNTNKTNKLKNVVNIMNAEETEKSKFFYLYYKRKESKDERDKRLDTNKLVKKLYALANEKL